ncbi:MAG: flagellar basal body L-ring protein FlgH [Chlorobia bacterium]|nr:flagellar basal body L-ring protein FlgH [Fimbriimonadaceae bacterium]
MKTIGIAIISLCASVAFAQVGPGDQDAGSLFNRGTKNPYLSRTAKGVGDILTIIVSESSTANYNVSTTAAKKDDNSVAKAVLPFISALKIPLLDQILGGLSTGASSSNAGNGATSQSGKFTTRVSVMVKQVLPNGNMIIEGNRIIKINREEQQITFTGIIREDDVRADNSILSERVAEAKITNLGKGLAADRQRRGILTRILDWLF